MDNNMGFHKERTYSRPQITHPEIKTDGSMFDFTYTTIYSLLNRSVFVLISGIMSTISNFVTNLLSNLNLNTGILSSYVVSTSPFNVVSTFIRLVTNLFINLFDTILLTLTTINIATSFTNLFHHISFIFSFNGLIVLYDVNVSFFEKSLYNINKLFQTSALNPSNHSSIEVDYISKS
jgi:uncharacterized membrane protein